MLVCVGALCVCVCADRLVYTLNAGRVRNTSSAS